MAWISRKTRQVEVSVVGVTLGDTSIAEMDCFECGGLLKIHQPEEGFPDRMLGTCPHCHAWFLWDFEPDHNRGVMVSLHDPHYFRDAGKAAGT